MYSTTLFQLTQSFDAVTSLTFRLSLLGHVFFLPQCPRLPYRADMSTPAFSTPPFLTVRSVPHFPLPQIGRVKFLISPTYSYGGATAIRARVTHLPLMEHGVLMVKVVMKSVVFISIQRKMDKWTVARLKLECNSFHIYVHVYILQRLTEWSKK